MPDLKMARDTFNLRTCTQKGCWVQDPVQAAMVGLPNVAREYVTFNFTRKDSALKFPAFWAAGSDYMPDEDNGGNGENGLQQMLIQSVGRKILLLPAWPKGWDADFKLNAPFRTTVQGRVTNGKISHLVVTPASRAADVIDMTERPQPEEPKEVFTPNGSVETILSPSDPLILLKLTRKGQPDTAMAESDLSGKNEAAPIDGNTDTKYFNRSRDGIHASGVNTGFTVTPRPGARPVTAVQIATGNDMPNRDPYSITIEGSNADDKAQDPGFVLLYEGLSGVEIDPGRKAWGRVIEFPNTIAYKKYRVLITETRNDGDGTQYSEVRLGTRSQK